MCSLFECVRVCKSEHPVFLCDSQVDEETARLANMPAWRRDIMKKKLEEEK